MAEGSFANRVAARELTIGVVGLGYVGLPLAVAYAEAGFRTVGFDIDRELADALNDGRSHIDDVSPVRVSRAVRDDRVQATVVAGKQHIVDCIDRRRAEWVH